MLRSTFLLPVFSLPSSLRHHSLNLPTALHISASLHCPPSVCKNTQPSFPPPTSAYIHLPFCRKRCHYCDFPIIALGSSSSSQIHDHDDDPRISNYINLLLREISSTPTNHTLKPPPLQTIFFGGGTPSLVPPRLIASLLDLLCAKFGISPDAEVSIEMDPGTFDRRRLTDIVGLGVNRVSLGVQAFQDELLRSCGRAHGLREVEEAIKIIAACDGLDNWSLDLISSLPCQSRDMWEESLRRTVEARPMHVSVYDLQVEQGTKFGQLYTPGEFPLPNETQSAEFYKMAARTLSGAGYKHYEISSYCRSGYECRHNLTYWQNQPFYGFGLGSASYLDGVRFSRPRRLKEYANYVEQLANGEMGSSGSSSYEAKDEAADVVMLSLRTARGLDVRSFERCYGRALARALCKAYGIYVESGHVVAMDDERRALTHSEFVSCLDDSSGGGGDGRGSSVAFLRLSDPDGFLLSNELISVAFGVVSP